MERTPMFFAVLLAASVSTAYAQTPAQPPAQPPAASSPQTTPGGPMMGGGIESMQQFIQKMQDEMTKIRSTTDPTERRKLLLEHMSTMREAMNTMMKAGGPGTGMMPGGGMMGSPSVAPAPDQLPGRMGMMEQRMGMMQVMMDQMIRHMNLMDQRK